MVRKCRADSLSEVDLRGKKVHCLGIGGVGVSGVAQVLAAQGAIVSGCDIKDSMLCDQLRAAGIDVLTGHDAAHVEGTDFLLVSSAVKENSIEYQAACSAQVPILHRSEALAVAGRGSTFVAVAGTHGKTTTSSMVAVMLEQAGLQPSFVVGGMIDRFSSNARYIPAADGPGSGLFVVEADESDASFLTYDVDIAVVTNIEADHLDYYGSSAKVDEAFETFARQVAPAGFLVVCVDDPGVKRLLGKIVDYPIAAAVIGYGQASFDTLDAAVRSILKHYYRVEATSGEAAHERGSQFLVRIRADHGVQAGGDEDKAVVLRLSLPGRHNALNAAAAFSVSQVLGVGAQQAGAALASFSGVARRFDFRGQAGGVRVYDDYAHHPTEVQAVLRGARSIVGGKRLHVIFQPHLYSRTKEFASEFAGVLDGADRVLVLGVYGAREKPMAGVSSTLITERMRNAVNGDSGFDAQRVADDTTAAVVDFVAQVAAGDVVLTIGAGDVTDFSSVVVAEMAKRDMLGGKEGR